jgi:hypothetical protein
MRTRLTLTPGQNGTRRLVAEYGDRLVCVRYRYDEKTQRRLKTVELVVEETSWMPPGALFLIRIHYDEVDLRTRVKAAGGVWEPALKLWKVDRDTVRRLSLSSRIVDPEELR